MLVIVKRGGVLFLAILVIVTFLIYSLYTPKTEETLSMVRGETVVIDPGHGAPDGGAQGVKTGTLEKDLNLAVSQKILEKLHDDGHAAILTREGDEGLYSEASKTIREKKREDMKKRVSIANAEDTSFLVSIHMNHFQDPEYSGPQVFYQTGSEAGKSLAECIRLSFLDIIGPHCTREIKPTSDLYLLRETEVPAVIVECGFLSNPKEDTLLSDAEYQEQLAEAIYKGIKKFKEQA